MLTALRAQRNRSYLQALVFVLLVSWLFSFVVSAACTMPGQLSPSADAMQRCGDFGDRSSLKHKTHTPETSQDCSLKPCIESQADLVLGLKLDQSEMPVFVLGLIGLIGYVFRNDPMRRVPGAIVEPAGRRIPLIYQFCILRN